MNDYKAQLSRNVMGATVMFCGTFMDRVFCTHSTYATVGAILLSTIGCAILALWYKRWSTRRVLEGCGIPTVFWRPKFSTLAVANESDTARKLSAKTITNILPRMQRLQGPFDMYGTVYGLSTAVTHVAHPVPATAILTSTHQSTPQPGRRASVIDKNRFINSGTQKSPAYNHFKNFCGEGVFTAEGFDWKAKRAAVAHALLRNSSNPNHGSSGIEHYERKVEREANIAANKLIKHLVNMTQRNRPPMNEINVVPLLQKATVGLIYRYITHVDLEYTVLGEDHEHSDVAERDAESVSSSSTASTLPLPTTPRLLEDRDGGDKPAQQQCLFQSYLQSIMQIRLIILAQSRSIWFLLPRWCYRVCSSLFRDEERAMEPIRAFSTQACQMALPGSPLASLREMSLYRDASPAQVSKNLVDEAITLLFAGQDTSAATLSWTLHMLTLYPETQEKLAEEILNILPQDEDGPFVSKKLASQMPYLDAVIKESMRLYPVAPFVVRRLPFDVPIRESDVSVTLPAGSLACIWIYSLHRNPKFWNRPDDFDPSRWLRSADDPQRDLGVSCPGAYLPFALGPRNCVGQPLAHIILRVLLSRIIHRFRIRDERVEEKGGGEDPTNLRREMQAGFTVLPQGGVSLSFHDRAVQEI